MRIRSFEELSAPDARTLLFGPFGLGAALTADQAAKIQPVAIAGADLLDAIPEPVKLSFERLRALHTYGVLFYDAYTLVTELRDDAVCVGVVRAWRWSNPMTTCARSRTAATPLTAAASPSSTASVAP
jgi:hypothetical protein